MTLDIHIHLKPLAKQVNALATVNYRNAHPELKEDLDALEEFLSEVVRYLQVRSKVTIFTNDNLKE